MEYTFTKSDIEKFSEQFGKKPKETNDVFEWKIENMEENKQLYIIIYLPNEENGLDSPTISVQNRSGFYELHRVSKYLTFDQDEVIFVAETDSTISSLIIGAKANCNLYSNIRKDLLKADFASVAPAELMAMTQLSILETFLD